jgi:hypothetical protein
LENQSPKSLPVTKMSRVLLIIYTKRDSEREVKILLERKKKPKKSYGRNLRWKSCIPEFMSRVFGLTSFLNQLEASSPCRNNDCS